MGETLRIDQVSELAVLLPFQLGYQPRDCLAVVAIQHGALGMTMRVDLPPAEHAQDLAAALTSRLSKERIQGVLVVAYAQHPGASTRARRALAQAAHRRGIRVRTSIEVHDGRWREGEHHSWQELPQAHEIPAVLSLIAAGAAPVASREAVTALVTGDPHERAILACATAVGDGLSTWQWVVGLQPSEPTLGEMAAALNALSQLAWRDAIIAALSPRVGWRFSADESALTKAQRQCIAELRGAIVREEEAVRPRSADGAAAEYQAMALSSWEDERARLRRLLRLARAAPTRVAPDVLALVGIIAWSHGDGTLARISLERARSIDANHRLTALASLMVASGMRLERKEGPADGGAAGPADRIAG